MPAVYEIETTNYGRITHNLDSSIYNSKLKTKKIIYCVYRNKDIYLFAIFVHSKIEGE